MVCLVLLPPSALAQLTALNVMYPLLFRVEFNGKSTHCGVIEFTAQEGKVHLPGWMIEQLGCANSIVKLTSAEMPSGSFVKLQPTSESFLSVNHPRTMYVGMKGEMQRRKEDGLSLDIILLLLT